MRDRTVLWLVSALILVSPATCSRGDAGITGSAAMQAASRSVSSAPVPNPFTVAARFNASSLGLLQPIDLTVGPDGIYITDIRPSVTVISPTGEVLRRWGSAGGPGRFSFPPHQGDPSDRHGAIAIGPDGNVYLVDSGDSRIAVFSPDGRFLRGFGGPGAGVGRFLDIGTITVDQAGNVYVVDESKLTISKFSSTGRPLSTFGGATGTDPDLRGHLFLVDVDTHGRLVTSNEVGDGTVLYLDASGDEVGSFRVKGAGEVTVDEAGDVAVQIDGGTTLVFDRSHRLIGAWQHSDLKGPPRFTSDGQAFALARDGSILKLEVDLPDE